MKRPDFIVFAGRKEKEKNETKQTPWPLFRKRTIPTERPPLVGEI
jgi:hypothetical protein